MVDHLHLFTLLKCEQLKQNALFLLTLQGTMCWFHRVTIPREGGSYWSYWERCQKGNLLQTGITFSGGVQLLLLPGWAQRHLYRKGLQ